MTKFEIELSTPSNPNVWFNASGHTSLKKAKKAFWESVNNLTHSPLTKGTGVRIKETTIKVWKTIHTQKEEKL